MFSLRCALRSGVAKGLGRTSSAVPSPRRPPRAPQQQLPQRRSLVLAAEWIGIKDGSASQDVLVVLHGLLGNRRNVQTLAKKLAERLDRRALLVDLRGHGASPLPATTAAGRSPTTLAACVADIHETLALYENELKGRKFTMVGHSLGGRLALLYAKSVVHSDANACPQNIWLLDTVPGTLDAGVRHVMDTAAALEAHPPTVSSRRALVDQLVLHHNLTLPVAQWLASSYDLKTGQFNFDLPVAQDIVADFDGDAFWQALAVAPPAGVRIDLVRGGANTSWAAAAGHLFELETGAVATSGPQANFHLHTLPDAGHWVHMDDLPGLLRIVEDVHANELE
jgi:pimeloyl-ACP methyl ester carboxylesterase